MAKHRTPDQIQADIAASLKTITDNVEGLVSEVHPTAVKDRAVGEAKTFVAEQVDNAKGMVVDRNGPRWDRIGTAAFVAVGVIVTVAILKGIARAARR